MQKLLAQFRLPFPPSSNSLFINVGKQWGRKKRSRAQTREYLSWQIDAALALKGQFIPSITERCVIVIDLDDRRQGDCANREKAVVDTLVKNRVLRGDQKKHVRRVSTGWEAIVDCRVSIYTAEVDFAHGPA